MPTVRVANPSEEEAVTAVLALAFSTDPGTRWVWPDPQQYLRHFSAFVHVFGGKAFAHGSAYYVDGYEGVALWLPPNVGPDDEGLDALLRRSTSEQTQKELASVFEQMARYHPDEPHWYLPLIGVDPFRQGKGVGHSLMQHALAACDRDNVPAFLESTNQRNVTLYERHGFEVLATVQVGGSPSVFPMLRRPRVI